jgi:hypothetical protein
MLFRCTFPPQTANEKLHSINQNFAGIGAKSGPADWGKVMRQIPL